MHRIRQSRIFRLGRKSSRPAGLRPREEVGNADTEMRRRWRGWRVAGHRFGARNEASGLALTVDWRTGSQTTFAITLAIAFRIGVLMTVRIRWQVGPDLGCGIRHQVPVGFAPQTGCEIRAGFASRVPFRFATETTMGTVLGTVRRANLVGVCRWTSNAVLRPASAAK